MSFLNFGALAIGSSAGLYLRAWGDASTPLTNADVDASVVIPFAGVLRNLFVRPGTPGAGADVATFTVQVNAVDTALVVAHTESSTSTSNTVNTVIVAAGDTVRIKVSTPGNVSGSDYRVVVDLQPIGTGAAAITLGALTLAATATSEVTATLAVSLGALTLAATGVVPAATTGTLAATLGPVTLAAFGSQPITGALAATLAGVTLDAAGIVPPPPPPDVDHVAQALRRLAQHLRSEEPGGGLVAGRAPALSVPAAPRFAVTPVAPTLANHATAARARLAQQFRFETDAADIVVSPAFTWDDDAAGWDSGVWET